MSKDTYQSIKNLSCGVLTMRNPEFQFASKVSKPHVFCQLEFRADLTSLCLKDLDTHPGYSLRPINVEEVDVIKHLKLQNYVEKYDLSSMTNEYTNPSLAGLFLYTSPSYLAGKKTMSVLVGGHNYNTIQKHLFKHDLSNCSTSADVVVLQL